MFLSCVVLLFQVATLRSAVKLEQEQQFLIAKKLQELTGSKNIKLKPIIDQSLIAGFVVEYGSSQIDLSIRWVGWGVGCWCGVGCAFGRFGMGSAPVVGWLSQSCMMQPSHPNSSKIDLSIRWGCWAVVCRVVWCGVWWCVCRGR